MPLLTGRENIAKNIKVLIAEGKTRDQAIAISLDYAKKRGKINKKRAGSRRSYS